MDLSSELLVILATISAGWVSLVSMVAIKNQNAITRLMASDSTLTKAQEEVHKDMAELSKAFKDNFSEMKDTVNEQMNKVNSRLDIFLKDEITVLKELVKK